MPQLVPSVRGRARTDEGREGSGGSGSGAGAGVVVCRGAREEGATAATRDMNDNSSGAPSFSRKVFPVTNTDVREACKRRTEELQRIENDAKLLLAREKKILALLGRNTKAKDPVIRKRVRAMRELTDYLLNLDLDKMEEVLRKQKEELERV